METADAVELWLVHRLIEGQAEALLRQVGRLKEAVRAAGVSRATRRPGQEAKTGLDGAVNGDGHRYELPS